MWDMPPLPLSHLPIQLSHKPHLMSHIPSHILPRLSHIPSTAACPANGAAPLSPAASAPTPCSSAMTALAVTPSSAPHYACPGKIWRASSRGNAAVATRRMGACRYLPAPAAHAACRAYCDRARNPLCGTALSRNPVACACQACGMHWRARRIAMFHVERCAQGYVLQWREAWHVACDGRV